MVSSQGSDSFHVYDIGDGALEHVRELEIDGVGATDGFDVVPGLLVAQSGIAPPPASTDPIAGYEYDGSSQFVLVDWE